MPRSAFDHDFEIFAWDGEALGLGGALELLDERAQIVGEARLAGGVERAEGLVGGAVVVAEGAQEVLERFIAELERATPRVEQRNVGKELAQARFVSPING